MNPHQLQRCSFAGVTLLSDLSIPAGVALAFTERSGGVSSEPYASLNLGTHCGDELSLVEENRRRALEALRQLAHDEVPSEDLFQAMIVPSQVHGDKVVVIGTEAEKDQKYWDSCRAQALEGADALVCAAHKLPILLCFADCVPVILVAPQGEFAVVHSGWRGTIAKISAKAALQLCELAGCRTDELLAYIGPHIRVQDYEVSSELLASFTECFGKIAQGDKTHLNLAECIKSSLCEIGALSSKIIDAQVSTAEELTRFFSWRMEGGTCGRHGALAYRI